MNLVGRVLDGRYALDGVLGDGAAGVVYRGVDQSTGEVVAVKVLHAALTATDEVRARFRREARALATLRTPHVVALRAFGVVKGGALRNVGYLVMERAEGATLAARLKRGPMAPDEVLAVLEPLVAALEAAHAAGIVHRDVKPDNVMLGPPLKLLDFSVARMEGPAITHGTIEISSARHTRPT